MIDLSRKLEGLPVCKPQELVWLLDRRVRRTYLEQQRPVVLGMRQLGAHLLKMDKPFAWNHVIHKVADPVRQVHGDQPVTKLSEQVHCIRPTNLIMRAVVAKPEPQRLETFVGSTNQLRYWAGEHMFDGQA